MRAKREGTTYQRASDGRWVSTYYDNDNTLQRVYAKTEAAALTKRNAKILFILQNLPVPDDKITVGEWLDTWNDTIIVNGGKARAQATLDNYAISIVHLKAHIGDIKLVKLKASDIHKMMRALKASGMSSSYRARTFGRLRAALTVAHDDEIIHRNVASIAKNQGAQPTVTYKERRTMTPDQAQAFLDAAEGDAIYPMIIASLLLGPRPGEVRSLKWDDIDLDAKTMRIDEWFDKAGNTTTTKTVKSNRTLRMPGRVVEVLRQQRHDQLELRLAAGPEWQEHGFVFTTSYGTPIGAGQYRRSFKRLTTKAGLGEWIPTEMRTSAVSLLSHLKVPREEIAKLLGHDGLRMIEKHYLKDVTPVVELDWTGYENLLGFGKTGEA